MNQYSEWTDEDLNTRICLLLGINLFEPQPIRDLRVALDLLKKYGGDLRYDGFTNLWACDVDLRVTRQTVRCQNPARAICEAWLLWKDAQRASDGEVG